MSKYLKRGFLTSATLSTVVLLSGCVFGGEQAIDQMKKENPPQEVTIVEEGQTLEEEAVTAEENGSSMQEEVTEFVTRELYLFDSNGYVVPQTVQLPKTKEVAKQAVEYMIQNGPITELLPNGFQAVLPQGTEVLGLNLQEDGTLVADFSKEFTEYKAEDELKILQAITWTLTQFENVEKVQIRINGYEQPFMPVNGTPINEGVSRANGINFDNGEVVDITGSKAVTLYFLSQHGDQTYYVPVTRRVNDNKEPNHVATIINELIKGPNMSSDLLSGFHPDIQLLEDPMYENGTVTLNFNNAVLGSLQGTAIPHSLLNSLVLSLTEQEGIESIAIQVDGDTQVYNESGDMLSSPVSRPQLVNTGSF